MILKSRFVKLSQQPWFISFILFGIFYLVTGYTYGWDDQHLEIPLLKHLIDHSLYAGDYYVESLKENFTSFFYPILASLIKVDQIPSIYFGLYLLSRYVLFYWIYKLWLHITKDKFKAIACVLTFILVIRVEEFLYRTFSHQEFALAIIFAGIYFFFKDRFYLSAILLGIAANFHALYSLFPMMFICLYLLWQVRRHTFKNLILVGLTYVLFALPWLIWIFKNRWGGDSGTDVVLQDNWISLFIIACPQNFFFPAAPLIAFEKLISDFNVFYYFTQSYLFLIVLFILNLAFNKTFQANKKAVAFCWGGFLLLFICFFFTYLYPNRFVIDLNLIRTTQFLKFFLVGFTVILIARTTQEKRAIVGLLACLALTLLKYSMPVKTSAMGLVFFLLLFLAFPKKEQSTKLQKVILYGTKILSLLGIFVCLYMILQTFPLLRYPATVRLFFVVILILLAINYLLFFVLKQPHHQSIFKKFLVAIPLTIFFIQFCVYSYQKTHEQKHGKGFWELQRNWEDMQKYVKFNTPKDALLLVPYDMEMGGFRIFSDRKLICSYRDCGIIGFDYNATVEWTRRMKDIEAFKVQIKEPPNKAIENAIVKYKADYIVFMQYAAPKDNSILKRVYTNTYFALFEVLAHPK